MRELWEDERSSLLTLPEYPYEVFRYETLRVNKNGFVSIDTNRYGLPPSLQGATVTAKIFYDTVEFYFDGVLICSYPRSYGKAQEVMDWTQYSGTLCKKPGAVQHTRFFHHMPEPLQEYLRQTEGKERRNVLQLLNDMVSDGNAGLCEEVFASSVSGRRLDSDGLRACYYILSKKDSRPSALDLLSDPPVLNYTPDLSSYDSLLAGGAEYV